MERTNKNSPFRQLVFPGHGFVVTPLSTGLRVGGAVELAGLERPPNYARSKAMLEKARQFLPGLKTGGGREWMGYRPSLPDSLPVIGRARGSGNVFYAFGHGHLGLTQSAATARLIERQRFAPRERLCVGRPGARRRRIRHRRHEHRDPRGESATLARQRMDGRDKLARVVAIAQRKLAATG